MPLVTWSDELSVHVKEFDLQHQKLVAILNELYDSMKEGKGKEVLAEIFSGLVDYTKVHFGAEERMFELYNYPDAVSHRAEHEALTRQALELKEKFNSGSMFVTIETLNFLRDWLSRHILETDRHYGAFFNGKGVN